MNKEFISVFWAWNSEMTKEDLKAQLVDFKEKGINNVFVHARAGLKIPYLSDEWMELFKYCCEIGKNIDVNIWIYDEYGWPSGFGGGTVYKTDDSFKERYLINVYDSYLNVKKDNRVILKVFDEKFNELKLDSLKEETKYNFICIITNDYYVDITNKDAVKCFLDTTHEIYKKNVSEYFGNVIPGVFTDEPHISPDGLMYSSLIEDEYKSRYGYDFLDIIKYLFFDLDDSTFYRYLYRKMMSDLINENYTKQYKKWCDDNNLILTGHYTCEEGLVEQVPTSGKLTKLYQNMGMIGIDALGNRLIPIPAFRRTMSIAYQTGNYNVLSETFAGTGYDASFNELERIWAYEVINGVTYPCLSISMSSLEGNRKRDYPQFFSRQMPWWPNSKAFFDNLKFIQKSVKRNRKQDILLIEPITSIYLSNRNDSMAISSSFRVLNESLFYSQLDFDYGDEEQVANAKINNKKICIGKCEYSKIILPFSTNIESKVLLKLKEFSDAGGEIYVVTPLPTHLDGKKADIIFDFNFTPIMNRLTFIRKLSEVNSWHDTVIQEKYTRKTHTNLSTAYRYEDGKEYLFVLNQDRNIAQSGRIVASGMKKCFMKSINDSVELPGVYNPFENKTEFNIDLKEMEYELYVLSDGEPLPPSEEIIEIVELKPLSITKDLNKFVVDKVCLSINNSDYDEKDYCLKKTSILYRTINGLGKSTFKAKYEFRIEDIPNELYAIGEYSDSTIYVNDKVVNEYEDAFYESAKRINILNYIKKGTNTIVIEKTIDSFNDPLLGKDVFQSISNVYSFPYYIESLILEGDFKVEAKKSANLNNYLLTDDDFVLIKDDNKIKKDLTTSGYPFYSGKVIVNYEFDYEKGDIELEINNTFASSNSFIINGKKINFNASLKEDITKYLIKGKNKLDFVMYQGLRNVFGPFHHKYGKHYYTGPSVFEGYAEWQDYVIYPELKGNTYIDQYSFVHLYIPNVVIKMKLKE